MSEQLLKEILSELKYMNQRVGTLETKVDNIKAKVDKVDSNQLRLETRMEGEVIDKVRVLFDAHSVHLDYFASIRDSQASIEEKLDTMTYRSINQNRKLDEHERELRLLRIENNK